MKRRDMAKKSQIHKFRDAARKIEADESEERFDSALRGLATARRKETSAHESGRKGRAGASGNGEDRS